MRAPLLLVALAWSVSDGHAQCGTCTTGDTCTVSPPFPTACPMIAPVGMVGAPYSFDVTFWIPPSFAEPSTGLNVVLQEVRVIGINNVPLGLTFEASHLDLIYYPQQDPFGCVRVCGIPMLPYNDSLVVRVLGTGTVGGIAINREQALRIPLVILPADGSNVGFAMSSDSACAPVTVEFAPLLIAPGLNSSFYWDFGNGNTYAGPDPPPQLFTTAGTHLVSLQTTVTVPMLAQVVLTGVSNAWCGDVDEPNLPLIGCVGQPDPYFTLTDALGGQFRSTTVSNVQSTTWNGLAIPLSFPPFTLRFYDSDAISADDLLGAFVLSGAIGTFPFSASGTAGSVLVQTQTVQAFSNVDSILVLPAPNTALVYDQDAGTLCAEDLDLVAYSWTLNGDPLPEETGPCVIAANGNWELTGTNSQGCVGSSSYSLVGLGMIDLAGLGGGVQISPVPNSGRFTVRASGLVGRGFVRISVIDAMGRTVHQEHLASSGPQLMRTIDLGAVAIGAYVLRLEDAGHMRSTRFLVSGL